MSGTEWAMIAVKIIGLTFSEFISLLGGIVACGFILGMLEREANSRMIRLFGIKGIYVTAWLGTPIHELGHAFMCLLFRHKVTEIKLLQAIGPDGTIGYIRHAYNPGSLYQRIGNLFIGVAPLISGSLAIALCERLLVPSTSTLFSGYFSGAPRLFSLFDLPSWVTLGRAMQTVFQHLFAVQHFADPYFWLFLLAALCISSRMSLSAEDIRGAKSGVGALFLFFLLTNAISVFLDPSLHGQVMQWIARFNFVLMMMLSLSVFFAFLVCFLSNLLYLVMRRMKNE